MSIHRYGMKARPFSIGAFPEPTKGYVVVEDEDNKKYHDVLQYHYKLPVEVQYKYELAYLGIRDE